MSNEAGSMNVAVEGGLEEMPKEVVLSLHQHLGNQRDELDSFVLSDDVDIEDILNQLIPDESTLPQTPVLAVLLRSKIQYYRQQILMLEEQIFKDYVPEKIEEIQELIGELLGQITTIRDAATESEAVVREITRDIQSLDLAKKHLIASMNALKRFQMLVNAFEQLTNLAKLRKYRETANALEAVKQLALFFKSFSNVDRVAAVNKGVLDVQGVLKRQVMREFEQAFQKDQKRTEKIQQLQDACLVVEALGEDSKNGLLSWYISMLLRDYRRLFGSTSEASQLDNISRRFAWFRRIQKVHEDENQTIFPASWSVGVVLTASFSEVTKDDLKNVLTKQAQTLHVSLLLDAIAETTEFQREMSRKYQMPFEKLVTSSTKNYGRVSSTISAIFEPFLSIFVDAQNKTISEMISNFSSSRISISPTDNPSAVLPSSTELFFFYREALEKCSTLTVGQPLLELMRVYKKWLKVYAEDILKSNLSRGDRSRSSLEGRPNQGELQAACLILNTAEYCHETAGQLEESLQEKIMPELKSQVSLESEKEIFKNAISSALLAIMQELETSIEPSLLAMQKSPWKDFEFVAGESAYVEEINRIMTAVVAVVREGMEQKKYVRSVCDKIVGVVLDKFTQSIVKCRPIPQIGAEQILLDLQSIKSCLLHLPLTPGDSGQVPVTYSRYVSKSVQKIDTLLKVLMTPEDPPEEFVGHYLLLIPCQSFIDFTKVLDLKGVRRAEQNNLLDIFLTKTSTETGLMDSSFLSGIELDSPQTNQNREPNNNKRLGSKMGIASRLFG